MLENVKGQHLHSVYQLSNNNKITEFLFEIIFKHWMQKYREPSHQLYIHLYLL